MQLSSQSNVVRVSPGIVVTSGPGDGETAVARQSGSAGPGVGGFVVMGGARRGCARICTFGKPGFDLKRGATRSANFVAALVHHAQEGCLWHAASLAFIAVRRRVGT